MVRNPIILNVSSEMRERRKPRHSWRGKVTEEWTEYSLHSLLGAARSRLASALADIRLGTAEQKCAEQEIARVEAILKQRQGG